jgi:hypothetical protein
MLYYSYMLMYVHDILYFRMQILQDKQAKGVYRSIAMALLYDWYYQAMDMS